ncbi:PRC-barrel domain-containing protein [Telmatospirillum sp. J64-1]|uniref:PRC-barrel domain-containing protein n=1 Tax=Telmatospirillum sp. J64-1 TaxID=2502183 RepID=UPI00115D2A0C|nr:PRC-barrel domain-containing protein [Telmatospirillum sp. J64-1]
MRFSLLASTVLAASVAWSGLAAAQGTTVERGPQTIEDPGQSADEARERQMRDSPQETQEQAITQQRSSDQQPPAVEPPPGEGPPAGQAGQLSPDAQELIGREAVGSDGVQLGQVADVLVGPDGNVEAVLVDRGGFLGLGATQVAVDWQLVTVPEGGDQVVIGMTEDQVANLPEHER